MSSEVGCLCHGGPQRDECGGATLCYTKMMEQRSVDKNDEHTEEDWARLSAKIALVLDALEELIDSPTTYHDDGSLSFHVPKPVLDRIKNQMKRVMEI